MTQSIFFSFVQDIVVERLIVVIEYNFQIWSKKEHIISKVIINDMGLLCIETTCISNYSIKHFNKVKWFQILLCITNNSIKHLPFGYYQFYAKQFYF